MRFSTVAVPCFALLSVLFAGAPAPSFAGPAIGTPPPPVGPVGSPTTLAPHIVSFKNYVGPSGISEQFFKGGTFKYAVEVRNPTNAAIQKKLDLRKANGNSSISAGTAMVSAGAGQTVTVVVEAGASGALSDTCAPFEYTIEVEGLASRRARTIATCTYDATGTDPWASLSEAEKQAKQQGKFTWYGATVSDPACGQKIKMSVVAKNNTSSAHLAAFKWHPLGMSERLSVAAGTTKQFTWELLQPFDGKDYSGHGMDLAPYAQGGPPPADTAPRRYLLKMSKSCTMATSLVN